MLSRRLFITVSATGFLTLWAGSPGKAVPLTTRAVPGALPAGSLAQFVTPLLVPPVMPRSGTQRRKGGKNADLYDISVRQFRQQVLPAGHPATTLWGFGPRQVVSGAMHHAPSFTIEADADRPVRVRWTNELVDEQGHHLPHLLPVDPTLHWANPGRRADAAGVARTDSRPSFDGLTYVAPEDFTDPQTQYTLYRGPVPWVTHLHGAVGVGQESDGYPEAWFLPDASDLPEDHASSGRWYDYFSSLSASALGQAWGPGYSISEYPTANRASTLWYHDHTLGLTRLNVYAGPAGFFIVRGGPHGDKAVTDARTGQVAVLPGPAPREGDRGNKKYREIPIAIQDRSFRADGSLFYPDTRAFFDGYDGPFIPETTVSPVWQPEFFGDTLIVNGATWPHLDVEQARYRLRILNGCNSRFLVLDFSSVPGCQVTQIGNDGGFLDAAHDVTGLDGGQVVLAPAERVDLVVDFTGTPLGNHVLTNLGPDEPYGGGVPGVDFPVANPTTTGRVLQFRVAPATSVDPSTPGGHLVLPGRVPLPAATHTRRVALLEHMHGAGDDEAPVAAMLGTVGADPAAGPVEPQAQMWDSAVTENPPVGATEVWEVYNATADAHPVHVHEVAFEVVDRQPIMVHHDSVELVGGAPAVPPLPGETGLKDTVIANPGEVTRIKATYATPGQYVWHCHIVEHEDNEMMRPFRIGPAEPAAPA